MALATLTPGATTGTGVTFTASVSVFLAADAGRQIIFGASRASITTVSSGTVVVADIIDDFPDTNPIPARSWFLRLSPQTTLDPDKKGPVGTTVTLTAGIPAFREFDVGKFIDIYGGIVKITSRTSTTVVVGTIMSEMSVTDADPAAAPAGSWTLEVASWSATTGFPRTGEFYQGRLFQASTRAQPTTFWGSRSDDFDNYAVGVRADDAIEYTIASRKVNRIEWLADYGTLFIGTAGAEFEVKGTNSGDPLGGDKVPIVSRVTTEGGCPIQPIVIGSRLLFIDRSRRKFFSVVFDIAVESFQPNEVTGIAEHIPSPQGFRFGPMAYASRPDPRIFMVRQDGQLAALTFFINEKVIGFTRVVTDGLIKSVAVVPRLNGRPDTPWVLVQRTINEETRVYVEFLEDYAQEFMATPGSRTWPQLQTDSAFVYAGDPILAVMTLDHLEGRLVDVVTDGSFVGQRTVTGGNVVLDEPATQVEIGLHYNSLLDTMRPSIENSVIEGLPRAWDALWARFNETIGGRINGEQIEYPPSPLNTLRTYTGDVKVSAVDWDTEKRVRILQFEPYPMTILCLFGELSVGDHG